MWQNKMERVSKIDVWRALQRNFIFIDSPEEVAIPSVDSDISQFVSGKNAMVLLRLDERWDPVVVDTLGQEKIMEVHVVMMTFETYTGGNGEHVFMRRQEVDYVTSHRITMSQWKALVNVPGFAGRNGTVMRFGLVSNIKGTPVPKTEIINEPPEGFADDNPYANPLIWRRKVVLPHLIVRRSDGRHVGSLQFDLMLLDNNVKVHGRIMHFPIMFDETDGLYDLPAGSSKFAAAVPAEFGYTYTNYLQEPAVAAEYPEKLVARTEDPRKTSFTLKTDYGLTVKISPSDTMASFVKYMYETNDGRFMVKNPYSEQPREVGYLEYAVLAAVLMRTGNYVRVGPIVISRLLTHLITLDSKQRVLVDGKLVGQPLAITPANELS